MLMRTSYCLKLDIDAGKNGVEEGTVGVMAVFDGHGGKEASEMASKLLLDYFYMHALFNSYKLMTQHKGVLSVTDEMHLNISKEALLRTIHDIDFKFSQAGRILFTPSSLCLFLTGFHNILIYVSLYTFRSIFN
jgi:serine/threonine protein phosphatase PrpC